MRLGLCEKDRVRDTGIDEIEIEKTITQLDRDVNFQAVRLSHADFGAFAEDLRFDKPGKRHKRKALTFYYALQKCEPGRAARSVSAHLRLAPVSIEELPPEIRLAVIFNKDQAISAHGHLSAAGEPG